MDKHSKAKKQRLYFCAMKKVMRVKYKRPQFVFLGEEPQGGAIILSNHEGTDAPMSLEIYLKAPIRMWGAYEMNASLGELYKYQTKVYYHEKKHWNLHLARLFCLIASPITKLFYSGLDLISTYHDVRFAKTIRQSMEAIKQGDNIVIFPEDSANGYLAEMEGFHPGFALLAERCGKRGVDVPIYVAYYRKADKVYIFDKPVMYSTLARGGQTKEQIAARLCARCNELGKMDLNNLSAGEEPALRLASGDL